MFTSILHPKPIFWLRICGQAQLVIFWRTTSQRDCRCRIVSLFCERDCRWKAFIHH